MRIYQNIEYYTGWFKFQYTNYNSVLKNVLFSIYRVLKNVRFKIYIVLNNSQSIEDTNFKFHIR